MIVKNCISELCLETRDIEFIPYQADLNMTLCIGTVTSPLFQECRFSLWSKEHNSDENCLLSSSLFHQLSPKNKTTDAVTMKFVEKFSELKLESPDEEKLEAKRVDNGAAEVVASIQSGIDQAHLAPDNSSCTSNEHLPVAKISIKETNRKPLCLSCNDAACSNKPKLNQNEKVTTETFNPFSQSLIPRPADKNGRRHCSKVSPMHTIRNGKSIAKQKAAVCASDTEIFNFYSNSPSADFDDAQLLHGNGGRFSEIHPLMSNEICRFDQEISFEQIGSCINAIDDQLSPLSVCSISSSVQSSSSPSSVNNIESYSGDTRNPSPSVSDLYPTPPSSVLENNSLQTSDYFSESSPDYNNSNVNDDSLIQFPFLDESFISTDASSPFSEKSECDTFSSSSSQDTINDIVWFLKNGNVDPVTAQIVNNCSKSFDGATDINCSQCDSAFANEKDDKFTQKLDSLPNPLISSYPTKLPAQLPSNIMPPICIRENNPVQPTVLLMPIQLQTITVSGQNNRKCHGIREIKPSINPVKNKIDLPKNEERCQVLKDNGKINSVYPGTAQYKSVKEKIRSTITSEEKKKLIKSALEETTSTDGSTKLHSSVISGNEKLVYVVIELMRTKIKTENLNSRTDNLNPRILTTEKIHGFVNEQDNLGCTSLYHAVFTGNNLLVAYLLECGANPFIEDYENGNTPYHIATLRGDNAIILMELLSLERNVTNVINKKGQTVLMAAVINHGRTYNRGQINGLKLIKHLLRNNHKLSSQDDEGRTALHIAAMKKDVELLEVLLINGTDAEKAKVIKDKEGNTILHDAALLANHRLIKMIIIHCSQLTEIKNNKGKLPYELINENREPERELLKNKFDECGFRNL